MRVCVIISVSARRIILILLSVFVFLVTLTEPDLPLKAIVFECVSAFATVGSSLGITSSLQDTSKVLLVVLIKTVHF